MVVDERTVKEATGVLPSVSAKVPEKWLPVIVIAMFSAAAVGVKEVMMGAGIKINPANDAVPPGVVKLTAPDEPEPTVAMMVVDERMVKEVAGVPPKLSAKVPVKFVPLMVIVAPLPAFVGEKEVIVGGAMNVNPSSDAVPPGVVRLTAPEEPLPTIATMDEEETTVNDATGVPPKVSTEVPLKLVPVIVMSAPAAAVVGANAVIVGAGMNVNPASEAEPPGVVRLTAPEEPLPTIATMAMMDEEETTVKELTGVSPNVMAKVLLKLVPVIVMSAPAAAEVGANAVIVGAGINVNPASDAVPPGVVRLTAPEEPLPTTAIMDVEETTVNELTGVPPNVMVEVLLKLVPVMVIKAPAAAVVGANAVIVGAGMNVNPASEAVPPGVVKLTAPEEPLPTIAIMDVEETTVNDATGVPPKVSTEVPLKLVPVILINAPLAAIAGANAVIVGAGMNVNPASEAEPPGVVKLNAPEEPLPTMAMIDVEETTVNEAT